MSCARLHASEHVRQELHRAANREIPARRFSLTEATRRIARDSATANQGGDGIRRMDLQLAGCGMIARHDADVAFAEPLCERLDEVPVDELKRQNLLLDGTVVTGLIGSFQMH